MARTPSLARFAALTAALTLAASSVQAQITLTPYVGSFYAVGKYLDFSNGSITAEQTNTAVFGGRLSFPIGAVLSIEGAFGYASSDVFLRVKNGCTDGSGGTWDCSTNFKGNVILGSARLQFRPRRSNLYGILGGAVVNHGGDAWKGTNQLTDFGAVVGFGLRASVTPRISLNMTAEAYIYSFDPDGTGNTFTSKTQEDLLFTVGVPIKLEGTDIGVGGVSSKSKGRSRIGGLPFHISPARCPARSAHSAHSYPPTFSTATGVGDGSVAPVPSCPLTFTPQQKAPVAVAAQVSIRPRRDGNEGPVEGNGDRLIG